MRVRREQASVRSLPEIHCRQAAGSHALTALMNAAFAGDAHDLLMAFYKDTSHRIELRLDAAKAAIGYEAAAWHDYAAM
jgi:hypothetical protein